MDRVLEFKEGEVQLRDEVKGLPEFKAIISLNYNKGEGDSDGRKRKKLQRDIDYIWYTYAQKSPFREYSESERAEEVAKLTSLTPKTISNELKAAIERYTELNYTRMLRLILSAERAVDKLRQYFDDLDFTQKTASGGLVNHPTDVIKAISDLDKVAESLTKLARKQKEEEGRANTSRGEQETGWVMEQDGNIND